MNIIGSTFKKPNHVSHSFSSDPSLTIAFMIEKKKKKKSPDRLKITHELNNFPWQDPQPITNGSASFLSLHFDVALAFPPGTGYYIQNDTTTLSYTSYPPYSQLIYFEFEKCWMVDGVPWCSSLDDPNGAFRTDLEFPQTIPSKTFQLGSLLCADHFGHWQDAVYDPQMAILFSLNSDPLPSDSNPASAKRSNTIPIAAGVTVAIVLVVCAVALVTVLAVPSLKARFIPSSGFVSPPQSKSNGNGKNPSGVSNNTSSTLKESHTDAPKASGWTKSSKPSTMDLES
jgi:hypothetical protein